MLRRNRGWALLLGIAVVGLIGCGGESSTTEVAADVPHAHVEAKGWRAELQGSSGEGSTLAIDEDVPAAAARAAGELDEVEGVEAGTPVSLTLEGGRMPKKGATITRRLAEPLARGETADLAYYDAEHDAWIAVPTRVSRDRRTLSARVHHFSPWDTILYAAGWLLDTRVDPPECEVPRPEWIRGEGDIVVLDDKNAPLRWCTGRDPRRPDVLVVKVRMNRSYGVRLVPSVKPEWMYDGLFQSGPDGFLTEAALRLNEALRGSPSSPGETILLGGEEVHYGFTEAQVRSLKEPVLVRAALSKPEALAGLTYTGLMEILGDEDLAGRRVAAVVSLVGLTQCAADIAGPLEQNEYASAAKGAYECLEAHSDEVNQAIALALVKALPKADQQVLGRISGKVSGKLWQIWAAGETFQIGALLADRQLLSNAFELHAFPDPLPRPDMSKAQLTPTGLGPVRLGMTVADVRKLRIRVRVSPGPYCDSWIIPGVKGVQMSVPHSSDRLESVFLLEAGPHAPRGVQRGDSVEELQAAYGSELEVTSVNSLQADFYRVYSPDRQTTLQFHVDQRTGKVEYVEVGLPGQFYYPDGNEMCA
jgi:hypothetical protein